MEEKLGLPPGDSVKDAIESMTRLVNRARLRCQVARRRWERTRNDLDSHTFLLLAQEYFYAAKLRNDFIDAALRVQAEARAAESEKKSSMN